MYKKILCLAVLAMGLNQAILANDADIGVGGNDYSTEVNTSNGGSTFYNPGIYFSLQAGTANLHYGSSSPYVTATTYYDNKYQFAGRGAIGYAFSEFISGEIGYDYYGSPKFWHNNGNNQSIVQQGMDMMFKASLPLDYGFGVYLKGGMAWVYRSALRNNNNTFADRDSNSKFPPIGALGINYWFAPNIALDLCWTKTMGVGSLSTIDLFTAGIVYKINI